MVYEIQYTPQESYRYPGVTKHEKFQWGSLWKLLFVTIAIVWIGVAGIPDFLIPGDAQQTKSAVTAMVERVREGEPVEDSVLAFCKQIINAQTG